MENKAVIDLQKQTINGVKIVWSDLTPVDKPVQILDYAYINPAHKYEVAFMYDVTDESVDWCIFEAKAKILDFINLRCDQAIEEIKPLNRFRKQWMEMQAGIGHAWISSQLPINQPIIKEQLQKENKEARDAAFFKWGWGERVRLEMMQISNKEMNKIVWDDSFKWKNLKISFMFAWYDMWVGLFIDKPKSKVYVFPIPMFGIVISW